LRQVSGLLQVLWFPPPIKLTITIINEEQIYVQLNAKENTSEVKTLIFNLVHTTRLITVIKYDHSQKIEGGIMVFNPTVNNYCDGQFYWWT
jgi:hypothetical protein